MAYADQKMSGNRVVAIIIVALIHVAVGYALITGLAYNAIKKAIEHVTTVDVKEPEPKPTEPPPPQPNQPPPPIVAPPPPINIAVAPPAITTVREAPPPPPVIIPVARPPAPPPPPPPQQANPTPKGRPQNWVTNNDYPSRALREELGLHVHRSGLAWRNAPPASVFVYQRAFTAAHTSDTPGATQ